MVPPSVRVLLTLGLLAVAGCAAPPPPGDVAQELVQPVRFDGLDPGDAVAVRDAPGLRELRFEGEAEGGTSYPGVPSRRVTHAFELDARVGFVAVRLEPAEGAAPLEVRLLDAEGEPQCGVTAGAKPAECSVPIARAPAAAQAWSADVAAGWTLTFGGRYVLLVTLFAADAFPARDPAEGMDASIAFRLSDTGLPSFEPTVGALADGTLFVQAMTRTLRSVDEGLTWQDVTPPLAPRFTFDPFLRVDPDRGRVYVDHLYGGCSHLSYSDDAGGTWTSLPAACGLPVNDHQKLAFAPSPLPLVDPSILYYTFYSFEGFAWVSRSLDGGATWIPSLLVSPADGDLLNTGPLEADASGNVVVPLYFCDDGGWVGAGVSNDAGRTFRVVRVSDEDAPCDQLDPDVAIGPDGVVYLAFVRPSGVQVAWSADAGATWSEPFIVSPPALRSFLHVAIVAGPPGKIALAYRATPDSERSAKEVEGHAAWRMVASFVEDATAPAPRVRSALVASPDDIVQRGPHCLGALPACVAGSRNIGDFIDAALLPDGRLVIAYDDGCDDPCPTPADSQASLGRVAVLTAGPRLPPARAP